jgi:hypothetical protein
MYLPLLSTNAQHLAHPGTAKHSLHSTSVPFARRSRSENAPAASTLLNKVVWEPVMCGDMVVYVRRAL